MNEVQNYFRKQDKFTADMIAAYEAGKLPTELLPYIQWKKGSAIFSTEQLNSMRLTLYTILDEEVEPEVESYLEAIVAELENILINYM